MTEIFNIASHFIHGKPIYRPTRRILNLLLNVSISSYFYIKWFGPYSWLDISNYKGILDFFIQGYFFIPFSIFIIVYTITELIGYIFFKLLTHFWSLKKQRKLLNYTVASEKIDYGIEMVEIATKFIVPKKLTKERLVAVYRMFSKEINSKALQEMQSALAGLKNNIEANFKTTTRIIVALLVYFGTVPHLNGFFFWIITLVLVIIAAFFVIAYRLLDVLPAVLKMTKSEGDRYLNREKKAEEEE